MNTQAETLDIVYDIVETKPAPVRHIFLRVFWSIIWRVTLIGALINVAVTRMETMLPTGELEQEMMTRVEQHIQKKFDAADAEKDPVKRLELTVKISEEISYVEAYEAGLRIAQEVIREQGLLSAAHLRDLLITLLPTLIATVIAVNVVLTKRWRRFELSVRDAAGNVRPTLWRPALVFSFVQYAPLFFISAGIYYVPWFFSSWQAFLSWNLIGLAIYAGGVYLALRWPYRSFHLKIEPIAVSENAA